MTLNPINAAKFFAILFPALVAIKLTLVWLDLAHWSFSSIIWQSAIFSCAFAFLYTAIRKPWP